MELAELNGKWQGTNQLWLSPEEPARTSASSAEISTVALGQFSEFHYTWADEDRPQVGRLILGREAGQTAVKAVWFDTWHMANQFMICQGEVDQAGVVVVQGSYAAPPGPDWGWQIAIEPQTKDTCRLLMHNISPAGEKMLAVEVRYTRQS